MARDPIKQAGYKRAFYERNIDRYKAESKARTDRLRIEIREYVLDYKSTHPCVDCGETDPIVLEFDHRGDKKFNIASAPTKGISLAKVIVEIAKCDVRCANCHRRKTHQQLGWHGVNAGVG